ncbi:unnamed protein product [Caenorhabditis brenneri]
MSTTSMSLKSLQFLLQHMEANKRFELSQRCPALREFEKSVPLKIDFLVLKESYVIVNDVTYELGIIRECKVGKAPWHVAATNARGGDPYEVDRYGIRDKSDEFMVTPGDVAMKQLTTVLFGGRCSPIYVKNFQFLCSRGVIRLPVGFKLHIERLVFCGLHTSVEVLAPILDKSSYPLKKLEIDVWSVNDDAKNPIVETAEILRINDLFGNDPQIILSMTNPVIHIPMWTLSEETILETIEGLVANRIASNLPIENVHVFDFDDGPRFESEVEDLLKSFNGLPFDDETVIIPLSDSTQLIVSYGPFPEFSRRSKWAISLWTEEIED